MEKLNCYGRTLERVVALLACEKFSTLDDIYKIVRSLDFSFIKPHQSFAIRAMRAGEHNFTSMDVARVAGQAVIDSYMASRNVRLAVNLDEPDVIIRVDVVFDTVIVGIDTTGDVGLHRRFYRVYNHPAPLNAAIAAALVRLSGWEDGKTLLDPMCGSGTILIEAAMQACNIPIRQECFDAEISTTSLCCPYVFGLEISRKHLKGCKLNASAAGVSFDVVQGDATKPPFREPFDVVITNPPYGLRIGRKGVIEKLYSRFLAALIDIIHESSKVVVITAESEVFKKHAEKYEILEERTIRYGGLLTSVFVMTPSLD
nr:tRNA (guanine(6)-N2)-methyltransferase [Archaeoglobus veneficus]